MFTKEHFNCPYCLKETNFQIAIWSSDFFLVCPHCTSIHVFRHNMLYSFAEHYKRSDARSFYMGTKTKSNAFCFLKNEGKYVNSNDSNKYDLITETFRANVSNGNILTKYSFDILKKSNKSINGKDMFVANGIFGHFQESLRALLRMKEHILNGNIEKTYNIFIVPKIHSLWIKGAMNMDGLDEIIVIDTIFKKESYDPNKCINIWVELWHYLSRYKNNTTCISKRSGPLQYKSQKHLQNIIDPGQIDNLRDFDHKGYIAILARVKYVIKQTGRIRVGFNLDNIFDVCRIMVDAGLPCSVLYFDKELSHKDKCNIKEKLSLLNVVILRNPTLEEQSYWYKNCCSGVVGPIGSGFNIPTIYSLPILSFAAEHAWTIKKNLDFYCCARMISPYVVGEIGNGPLIKQENVTEVYVEQKEAISFDISTYELEIKNWIKKNY